MIVPKLAMVSTRTELKYKYRVTVNYIAIIGGSFMK